MLWEQHSSFAFTRLLPVGRDYLKSVFVSLSSKNFVRVKAKPHLSEGHASWCSNVFLLHCNRAGEENDCSV